MKNVLYTFLGLFILIASKANGMSVFIDDEQLFQQFVNQSCRKIRATDQNYSYYTLPNSDLHLTVYDRQLTIVDLNARKGFFLDVDDYISSNSAQDHLDRGIGQENYSYFLSEHFDQTELDNDWVISEGIETSVCKSTPLHQVRKLSFDVDSESLSIMHFKTDLESKGTILYYHGGPYAEVTESGKPAIWAFLDLGYDVIAPNYPGSSGSSTALLESGFRARYDQVVEVAFEAFLSVTGQQRPDIVAGASYGAFLSFVHAKNYPDSASYFIPIAGPCDIYNHLQDVRLSGLIRYIKYTYWFLFPNPSKPVAYQTVPRYLVPEDWYKFDLQQGNYCEQLPSVVSRIHPILGGLDKYDVSSAYYNAGNVYTIPMRGHNVGYIDLLHVFEEKNFD